MRLIGLDDPRQGMYMSSRRNKERRCCASRSCAATAILTHGAFGAYAFGIDVLEVAHVLMTQTFWQKRPKRMRISIDGALGRGISMADLALNLIARIGADGAQGHAIEYAGAAVRALSMEGRMTLCNLSIEVRWDDSA